MIKMIELRPTGKYYLLFDLYTEEIDPKNVKNIDNLENFVCFIDEFGGKLKNFLKNVELDGDKITVNEFEIDSLDSATVRIRGGRARFAGIVMGDEEDKYKKRLIAPIVENVDALEALGTMEAYVFEGENGKYYIEMEQLDYDYWLLVELERV